MWYLVGPLGALSLLGVVGGVAAIRSSWLPSWMGKRTFRPRLWGYAEVLFSVNLAVQLVGRAILSPRPRGLAYAVGFVLLMVALGLLRASQRPERTG